MKNLKRFALMGASAALLGGAATVAALSQRSPGLASLPGIVMAGLILDRAPAAPQWLRRNAVFNAMVATFLTGMFAVPFLISTRLGIVVALGVGVLVMLNRGQYEFFMRQRGVGFALAAMPFHLLYYLYSVAAFGLGAGYYLWRVGPGRVITTDRRPSAAAGDTGLSPRSQQWARQQE